eukprot:gnl/TRDRNA2_/TRDRNA2_156944_c0_seq1.p1 gnl/TRDRNA2_/TRDRNA2_156944_c0~~gnl/TRDRNA2_/TRDRNA2_156944_c0_seq1.p1  ORF type:complete len:219 (+),score=15.45 gnl/TRDRNA2_/TRDRNA2_156944_c0_seq1:79-657(+)
MGIGADAVVYVNLALYALSARLMGPVNGYLLGVLAQGDAGVQFREFQAWTTFLFGIGSLAMGLLLDIWGARLSFVLCYLSTALSYGLVAVARSMMMLYLAQIPTFLQNGYLLSQIFVLRFKAEEHRGRALGFLTLSYMFGAQSEPYITMAMGESQWLRPLIATGLSLLSVIASTETVPNHPVLRGRSPRNSS